MFTAEEGSSKLLVLAGVATEDDEEGDMLETVPVPQISAGDAAERGSDLTSRLDALWPVDVVVLMLLGVKELKFFLT